MKAKNVLESLRGAPDNQARLKDAAGDLGDEMFSHREDVIREFRAGLVSIKTHSLFGDGYVAALADVAAGFHARLMREDDEAFLAKQRKKKI